MYSKKLWEKITVEEIYAIVPVLICLFVFTGMIAMASNAQTIYSEADIVYIEDPSLQSVTVKGGTFTTARSTYRQDSTTTEYVKQRICEVFGDHCSEALIIAKHESGYNIMARSGSDARGVMQIHCPAHKNKVGGDCDKLYNLEINLKIAHNIFLAQGWRPWTARKFLPTP